MKTGLFCFVFVLMSQRETAYTNAGSLMLETELSVFDVLALSSGVDRLLLCAGQKMVAVQQQTALPVQAWLKRTDFLSREGP